MPRVPVYNERQVAPRGVPSRGLSEGASPESFGAGLWRGIQTVGSVFAGIAQQEREKADRAATLEADNALDTWEQSALFDPDNGAFTLRGKAAFDLPNQVLPQFDSEAQRIESTLGSDTAKQAFRARLLARRQGLSERLNQHELREREGFYDEQDKAKLSSSRAMAGNYYSDPERIAGELATQDAVIEAHGARKGWSAEQIGQAKIEQRSGTHVDVVNRYIARGEWRRGSIYFEEVRDQITGDEGTRIESALTSERRREEAERKAKLTEARQALTDQARDIMAAAELGLPIQSAPSREQFVSAFGEREGEQRYNAVQLATRLSGEVTGLNQLPTAELIQRAESFKPTSVAGAADQAPMYAFLNRSTAAILTARENDPAGYLTQHSPTVQRAWTALQQSQAADQPAAAEAYLRAVNAERERLGIRSSELLPKTYADGIVERLTRPQGNETLATTMAAEAQRWGPAWPSVYRQLAKDLPDTALVIGSGIPQRAANALASVSQLKDDELKARIATTGTKWRDVEDEVDSQLEDLAGTFGPEGAPTFNAIRSSAQKLTAAYMAQGSSLGDAAEQATKDLANERYTFEDFRGHSYRVPIDIDPDVVDDGATAALGQFHAETGTVPVVPGQPEEILLGQASEHVRRNGYWVTAPDESGLRLYLNGQPVPTASGRPVQYTWEQLRELASQVEIERVQRERQEAARRAERR